jgi:hypothetical protein
VAVTNTPAYYDTATITAVESFTVQAPSRAAKGILGLSKVAYGSGFG